MSFILENKELIDQFIQTGLAFEKKFNKSAQGGPRVDVDLQSIKEDLLNQLANPTATIGTNLDKDINITSGDLSNISNLVKFLTTNQITVDGKRITFLANELQNRKGFAQLNIENNTYYIDKTLLTTYLQSLQAEEDRINNTIVSNRVKGLLNDAKNTLQIEVTAPATTGKGTEAGKGTGAAVGDTEAPLSGDQISKLQFIANATPIDDGFIDITETISFVQKIQQLTKASKGDLLTSVKAGLDQAIININNAIQDIQKIAPRVTQFKIDMYTRVEDIKQWIQAPYIQTYAPFLAALRLIVSNVQFLFRSIYTQYKNKQIKDVSNIERLAIGSSCAANRLIPVLDGLARMRI
jgi:hypothetical protein